MWKRFVLLLAACALATGAAFAQGLETTATKDDWEEINFEFDSSILSDGYPSLLRLAELLNRNPDYRVTLTGHTDFRGSEQYNVSLGRRRAETVKAFLVKYGARDGQIAVETRGQAEPAVPNTTDEGRFINRRVTMTVMDGQGAIVSAGGVGDAIGNIEKLLQKQEECCNEILEKLTKLDEILDLLGDLKAENDRLKRDVAELMGRPEPKMPDVPTTSEVAGAVRREMEDAAAAKPPSQYTTFNINAGPSSQGGNLSVTGQGRIFIPFAQRHALQTQGEYMHHFQRDEGQFDIGLVSRWGDVQVGGFSSFKTVKFSEWQNSGTVGQGAFTLDYVFGRGRVGFFGTKSFLDGAVVNERLLERNFLEQTYMRVVDQVGVSTAVAAWGDSWFEGNMGALFRSAGGNKPGGTIRYIHPLTRGLALTLEGGLNETFIRNNNEGRFVVGLQFGSWLSPNKYKEAGDRPVPVDVPRVRYEVLTRNIRTGNDAPVADGGGDQIGVDPGEITLDGSNSFDPDGDPITFQWTQIGGEPVTLSGAQTAVATFTAEEGQTYHFRLNVRDDQGGVGTDRVTVSTASREITIRRFTVSPTEINAGDTVTLNWDVSNAESVEITPNLGSVDSAGSSSVTVNETTTFTLTGRNRGREISESVTVTVRAQPVPRVFTFTATPMTISRGEATVLAWETENADSVSIEGIGSVGVSGTATVSPTETTTYRLTARGPGGEITRTVTVTVGPVNAPRVVQFVASPQSIESGQSATLTWEVEGAETIMIDNNIGTVDALGSINVNPTETTRYTMTATNAQGQITASVIVNVRQLVRIVEFKTNKPSVREPGDPAVLSWVTEGATHVELVNYGTVDASGSQTVNPVGQTLYTLIAVGEGAEVTATVIIDVEIANRAPVAVAEGPFPILVPAGTEWGIGQLDGSKSYDPDGDPITYQWRSIGPLQAVIRNPSAVQPTVEFRGGFGRYEFELTVTDDKGASGIDTVEVFWVDP